MSFQQSPPSLGNQYEDDRVLRSYLSRVLPEAMLSEIEPSLRELGRLAGDDLYRMQLAGLVRFGYRRWFTYPSLSECPPRPPL